MVAEEDVGFVLCGEGCCRCGCAEVKYPLGVASAERLPSPAPLSPPPPPVPFNRFSKDRLDGSDLAGVAVDAVTAGLGEAVVGLLALTRLSMDRLLGRLCLAAAEGEEVRLCLTTALSLPLLVETVGE